MNGFNVVTLAFHMDPIQHRAMLLEHPAIFRPLRCTTLTSEVGGTTFSHTGEMFQIARMLDVLREWKHRPATEEELGYIFGEVPKS